MNENLKSKLQPIRAAMDVALAQIAKDHGLQSLKAGRCGYDPASGNFTFKVEGIDGDGISTEAARYNLLRKARSLPPLGTEFKGRDGATYKIVGLNTTATKVLCKRDGQSAGGHYLFKPEFIERFAGLQKRGVKVTSELVRKLGEDS
jgi:hypothetical protein